jgi:VanZ family protein
VLLLVGEGFFRLGLVSFCFGITFFLYRRTAAVNVMDLGFLAGDLFSFANLYFPCSSLISKLG